MLRAITVSVLACFCTLTDGAASRLQGVLQTQPPGLERLGEALVRKCFPPGTVLIVADLDPAAAWLERLTRPLQAGAAASVYRFNLDGPEHPDPWALPEGKHAVTGYIAAGSAGRVRRALRLLVARGDWNPAARFLVVTAKGGPELLHDFWTASVPNVLLALVQPPGLQLLTIFPYANASQRCGGPDIGVRRVGSVAVAEDLDAAFQDSDELFPNKIPSDLGGCVVRVNVPIIEAGHTCAGSVFGPPPEILIPKMIFEAAARFANFTPEIVEVEDTPIEFINGSYTGRFGLLHPGGMDMAIDKFMMRRFRYQRLSPTVFILPDKQFITVRCGAGGSPELLSESTVSLAAMLLVAMGLTVALLVLCERWSLPDPRGRALAYAWSAVTEVATPLGFNTSSARIVFSAFLLFVLSFNVAVKGFITSQTTRPRLPGRIRSISELLASDLQVGVLYESDKNTLIRSGFEEGRVVYCKMDAMVCENLFESPPKFALLNNHPIRLMDKCSRLCEYDIPDPIVNRLNVQIARRSFPLLGRIDSAILGLHSGGIIEHWLSSYVQRSERRPEADGNKESYFNGAAYLCLGVGLTIACIAFALELSIHRMDMRIRPFRN